MADIKAIADQLVSLTVKEVQELAKVLKDEHGIEPAAAAVVVSGGGSALLCYPESECIQGEKLYDHFLKSGQTIIERRRAIRVDREVLDCQAGDAVEQGADERSLHHIGPRQLVRHPKTAGEVNDRVIRHARLDALIGRPRQNVAEGIEQLNHGVEPRGCFVDVDPDL